MEIAFSIRTFNLLFNAALYSYSKTYYLSISFSLLLLQNALLLDTVSEARQTLSITSFFLLIFCVLDPLTALGASSLIQTWIPPSKVSEFPFLPFQIQNSGRLMQKFPGLGEDPVIFQKDCVPQRILFGRRCLKDSVDINFVDVFHCVRELLEAWCLQAKSCENIFQYSILAGWLKERRKCKLFTLEHLTRCQYLGEQGFQTDILYLRKM